jgi:hypothetical protein
MNLLKLKFVCSSFISFLKQRHIRSFIGNIKYLYINTRIIFSKDPESLYIKKHELNRELLKTIIPLKKCVYDEFPVDNYKIWVLWWQGYDAMPEIVKCTYNSICRMTGKDVVLITKDNISEYINIDSWIEEKVHKGFMKLPAFSDYIRAYLLFEYGGMWIDSTVLFTRQMPKWIYEERFFTIHNNVVLSNKYVAMGRWNVQILGTNRKHLQLFGDMLYVFREYWRKYNYIMDYLLVDYSIDYSYNERKIVKGMIDSVPVTNGKMHTILGIINNEYNEDLLKELEKDTWMFKLTYKCNFKSFINNKTTFYKKIIEIWK